MILSITDGIEVAEHTEPQERCEFLIQYKEMIVWHERARTFAEIINRHNALTVRQAE